LCFARKSLCAHITDTHHAHVITGFGRVVANKAGIGIFFQKRPRNRPVKCQKRPTDTVEAGIGISFDLYSTSFLFVTAHFAAGSKGKAIQTRNADFERIDSALVQLMCPAGISVLVGLFCSLIGLFIGLF